MPRRLKRAWRPRRETLLVVASALLFQVAQRPYAGLPPLLEAWLPAVLVVLAPAPALAAFARAGGVRQAVLLAAIWWGLGGFWLIAVHPVFGVFAWLGMTVFAVSFTWPLGLVLRLLRERCGPSGMLWLAPAVWVAWEMVRTWTPIGCPWFSLGHSFWKLPLLLQVCELTGYRGLSLVVATLSAGLARLLLRDRQAGRQLAVGLALALAVAGYGWWRLPRVEPGGEPLAVALVQANIPLEQKSAGDVYSLFYEHLGLTYEAPRGTRLVVWPETAVPTRLMHVPEFRERLQAAARALRATLVVGGVATIPAADPLATQVANAAFVLDDQGRLVDDYHKVHLVILGEYLPLRNWPLVSAIARLTPQFWAGSRYRAVATPLGRVGIPICYESAFPGDVRAMVKDGAGALVVITNDDQLSETGARQLFQQTVFRSVETRRWMARCANSGISCFVAPSGRVVSASEWDRRTLHTGMLRLHNGVTFYVRCGDWLPWLCLLVTAAALLQRRRGNEK